MRIQQVSAAGPPPRSPAANPDQRHDGHRFVRSFQHFDLGGEKKKKKKKKKKKR
jgi:hypothetical protein